MIAYNTFSFQILVFKFIETVFTYDHRVSLTFSTKHF